MSVQRNYLHVIWRVPALLIWLLVMPLLYFLLRALKLSFHQELPHYFHVGVQKIFGLAVTHSGARSSIQPTLYVSNHISYLDIFVLGDIRAWFIAKSEVAGWPLLGQLARFQNTLFIERKAGRARQQLEVLQAHLNSGQSLILFPEGTSTDGAHVEPFKSSLFEAANIGVDPQQKSVKVAIQPITVVYTHQAGRNMNQQMRDSYAWYANMPFAGHFFALFPLKKVDVKVHFHPVVYSDEFATRKQCAEHCYSVVSRKMHELLQQD